MDTIHYRGDLDLPSSIVYAFHYGERGGGNIGSALGDELRSIRRLKGETLKATAKEAGISTAYLHKLETGDVKSPSPNVLHAIADSLDASYSLLMELASYIVPGPRDTDPASAFDSALASTDLSATERGAVAAYIALLRQQRSD